MEILRNGYRSSSLQHVFDQLFQYAASPANRMYSGDVEIAANVLLKILQHLVKSPSLYYGGPKISFVVRPIKICSIDTSILLFGFKFIRFISVVFHAECRIFVGPTSHSHL